MTAPAGRTVSLEAAGIQAHAWGESTAPSIPGSTSRQPKQRPVQGRATGTASIAKVRVPPHGKGLLVSQTPTGRATIEVHSGEGKGVHAIGNAPHTAKIEGNVSSGGRVAVASYAEHAPDSEGPESQRKFAVLDRDRETLIINTQTLDPQTYAIFAQW